MSDGKRTCAITGASAGIGKATAIDMARRGCSIVMFVRDCGKSRRAAEEVKAASGSDDVRLFYVDLSSRESIASAVEEVKRAGLAIDILVNNAGVYKRRREVSADGIEMTLAVNFAAPFMLTNLIVPLMEGRPDARIVNLASEHFRSGRVSFSGYLGEGRFNGSKTYASSKLLVVLWTRELARRLKRSGITANCVHPGVVGTDVFRDYPRWFNALMTRFISKPEVGASPVVYLATSPQLAGVTGEYFCKKERRPLSGPAADDSLGHRVWEYGTTLAAVRPGVD